MLPVPPPGNQNLVPALKRTICPFQLLLTAVMCPIVFMISYNEKKFSTSKSLEFNIWIKVLSNSSLSGEEFVKGIKSLCSKVFYVNCHLHLHKLHSFGVKCKKTSTLLYVLHGMIFKHNHSEACKLPACCTKQPARILTLPRNSGLSGVLKKKTHLYEKVVRSCYLVI